MEIILYGTLGCHLCDQAKVFVEPLLEHNNISFSEVDIAEDDALLNQYGTKIPVIKSNVTGNELNWPFDAESFFTWLEEN